MKDLPSRPRRLRRCAAAAAWQAVVALAIAALVVGCSTTPTLGGDDLMTAGAAGGERAVEAAEQLERCTEPLGTVGLTDTGDPFVPIVRMIVQQSNCFIVVERGRAYNNVDFERQLKQAGLTRNAQAQERTGGALLSADYTLVPSVTFAEPSGFALSTGLGGLFGRSSNKMDTSAQVQALGASTTLLLLDNASGAQIVAAQGSAKNYNLGAGVGVLGGLIAGVNAYANTPQGKIVAAAFLDAYNKLVLAARQYAPQKAQGAVGQGGKLKGP
ncbi:CsgG/HfaB family protein [Pelomicrobium methylotrophicum]|uniref:Peptidoglycan-binding protein n=1 Tax=Pelomicrobium methylotrophicum TaxID=2602750 RepID=A0A5C7EQ14_9PROT|nr:CsgG/HfaB family protein [Pelomicrobium methylotrophicum]TXF13600.1 peptidoglycan-binding protein [Pelomicrobium methylotrophicum]